jgi:ribosomal protein L11 methyltransferase
LEALETTSVLVPFQDRDSWSILSIQLDARVVPKFVQSLAAYRVDYYPAGDRGVLTLGEHGGGWRASVDDFVASHGGTSVVLDHDAYDASWRLPDAPVVIAPGVEVVLRGAPHSDVIVLNPGLAFGDCRHPTTRLCADAIVQRAGRVRSLLDVGSGSGILALLGARLGIESVAATDIDAYCRFMTKHNAEKNNLDVELLNELPRDRTFDLVVANVWASAFPSLATRLEGCLAKGGTLVASGFPSSEADAVASLFTAPATRIEADGWCALVFEKTG